MITIQLEGGMGNQMFQYAFGKALSLKFNQPLQLDLGYLYRRDFGPNFVYRSYDLDLFMLKANLCYNAKKVNKIREGTSIYDSAKVLEIENLLKKGEDVYIEGYWQCEKYFNEFEYAIRRDFRIRKYNKFQDLANKLRNEESVAINVRRTDFLNNDFHPVKGMDYIQTGIDALQRNYKNLKFYVFSDDITWCRENLPEYNIIDHTYKGERFASYLELMSSCKHFIIPNSSFGWWAAWLSGERGLIIAPYNWFNNTPTDIVPDRWTKITD